MKPDLKTPPAAKPEANDTTGSVAKESEALLKDLAEQKDLHLRLAADFENYKRRSRQEIETRAAAQKDSLIAELLPVIDNLERALASGVSRDSAQFHQGVENIEATPPVASPARSRERRNRRQAVRPAPT